MDGLFAGTPPLEALRFLVHEAATVRADEEMGTKVIMINDVARAFFEAPATRDICIEIPKEDLSDADRKHDKVGHLRMSLYGTRDAAMNWQEEVAREMLRLGFQRGKYNPCLYYHRQRNLRTFLHGDDFATVGTRPEVQWFKSALEKRFEIKTQCVGPGAVAGGLKKVAGTVSGPAPTTAHGEPMQEGSEGRLLNRSSAALLPAGRSRLISATQTSSSRNWISPVLMGLLPRVRTNHAGKRVRMMKLSTQPKPPDTGP